MLRIVKIRRALSPRESEVKMPWSEFLGPLKYEFFVLRLFDFINH